MIQGTQDPLWSIAEWDLIFNEAIDILHENLVDADAGYFLRQNVAITKNEDETYSLPSDLYSIVRLGDEAGTIQFGSDTEVYENLMQCFTLQDNKLILHNFASNPETLYLTYYKDHKDIPTWDGTVDPDTPEFTPEPPLDTNRAARTLARIMQVLAQSKDDTNSEESIAHMNNLIERFVDRLHKRQKLY